MKKYNLAVVGATGMVGRTFIKVLEERKLPYENIFFSSRSFCRLNRLFRRKGYTVEEHRNF